MARLYLNTLTPKEIIDRLKNGEIIKFRHHNDQIYYSDGLIIRASDDTIAINSQIVIDGCKDTYFESKDPFEINKPGLYQTRDGRKAFVSRIEMNFANGIIYGERDSTSWYKNGCHGKSNEESPDDLVESLEEDVKHNLTICYTSGEANE